MFLGMEKKAKPNPKRHQSEIKYNNKRIYIYIYIQENIGKSYSTKEKKNLHR